MSSLRRLGLDVGGIMMLGGFGVLNNRLRGFNYVWGDLPLF